MPGTYVIEKNFNPVNRTEFNPGLQVLHIIGLLVVLETVVVIGTEFSINTRS